MSLWEELLDQADHLLTGPLGAGSGPSEADIRRALSNAYYALFHLLVDEATNLLCPVTPPSLAARFRRAFAHAEMKAVCGQVSRRRIAEMCKPFAEMLCSPIEAALVELADIVIIRQVDRHAADYGTGTAISPSYAQAAVNDTRRAIASWHQVRDTGNARVFLTALLLAGKWSRD